MEDGEFGATNPWLPNNLLAEFSPTHKLFHLPFEDTLVKVRYFEVRAVPEIMVSLTSSDPLVLLRGTWPQCEPLLSWSQQNFVIRGIQWMWLRRYFLHTCLDTFFQPKFWFYYRSPFTYASIQRHSVPDDLKLLLSSKFSFWVVSPLFTKY